MPSPGKAARARIASLLLAAVLAGQAGCRQQDPPDNAANGQNVVEQVPSRIPLPEPPLDRAALLMAIAKVASAHATGADQTEAQRLLDGKPFELRIRFGCGGPSADLRNEPFGWTYDGEERTLRVRATPTISQQDAVAAQIGGDAFEAIEGFWLARPWLLESACPVTAEAAATPTKPSADKAAEAQPEADSPDPPAAPPAAVGIAQFFATTDSRTRQRSLRPYAAVKTLEPNEPVGPQGFDLVLSGRLRALPDKRIVACVSSGPDLPPKCIVSADFDRVRIERADKGEIVAEWGTG